jgi:hypothetical protein
MAGPSARGAAHQTSHVLREAAFRPSRFIDRTYHLSIREVKKKEKKNLHHHEPTRAKEELSMQSLLGG